MLKRLSILVMLLLLGSCSSYNEKAKQWLDKGILAYTAKEYAIAYDDFIEADKYGHMKAQRYLGLMALKGEGIAKNEKKAFQFFQNAANKGDITSQYWLGYLYEIGIGTDKNMDKAIEWYKRSAQRGDHVSFPAINALKRLGIIK